MAQNWIRPLLNILKNQNGMCCYWNVLFLELAVVESGMKPTRNVPFRQNRMSSFGLCSFSNSVFLEYTLFGMCSFWNVPEMEWSLNWMCPFWNVIKIKCYQNGMCSFGKCSFGLNIEFDQNGLCSFCTLHTVNLSDWTF